MRRRDSAATKQLLLDAASRRFAADGYAATFIRDIAGDAGVNVALIARYFGNKEGLFRACLTGSADDLERSVGEDITLDQVPALIARQLTDTRNGTYPTRLLMLLRSSGDERAEQIRLSTLRSFAERLAAVGGAPDQRTVDDQALLDAQFILATTLGVTLLRAAGLRPLSTAGQDDLTGRLRRLISAMLSR